MEIIKKGNIPAYIFICSICECEFRVAFNELERYNEAIICGANELMSVSAKCPECGYIINKG